MNSTATKSGSGATIAIIIIIVVCILLGQKPGSIPTSSLSQGVPPLMGKPTISVSFIEDQFRQVHSPALGTGQALYDDGVAVGVNPAYALGFFMSESTDATKGVAAEDLSLGNIRCEPQYACNNGYARYPSWDAGYKDWYRLIKSYVQQRGLTTLKDIIHVYAPAADHNDEANYVAGLESMVATWSAKAVQQ